MKNKEKIGEHMNLEIINEKIKKACMRRGFSQRTIETYQNAIKQFAKWYSYNSDVEDKRKLFFVKKSEITSYMDYLVEKNASQSTLNISRAAILFLLTQVYGRRLHILEKYAKIEKKLPVFLTKKEISDIEFQTREMNKKHRLAILLMYDTGARVSECINFKVSDFDFDENFVLVRNGKGRKDRFVPVSNYLLSEINEYIAKNNLGYYDYLFYSGKNKNKILSVRTIQEIVKTSARKAKISKRVHPHTLRHSFATHVVENGHPILDLSRVMGHNSLDTTMVYLHTGKNAILNVKSPLDELYEVKQKSLYSH